MEQMVQILKALSDPNRLRIVYALRNSSLCACQLIELLNISGAGVSQHMNILTSSGVCKASKDGRWVHFSLNEHPILDTIFQECDDCDTFQSIQEKTRAITGQNIEDLCLQQRTKKTSCNT